MRKITEKITTAFLNKTSKRSGNTTTNGSSLFLHGNEIARHTADGLEITHAGWPTTTTKDRLNALPGVRVWQKEGQWFLNGQEWDGNWIKI